MIPHYDFLNRKIYDNDIILYVGSDYNLHEGWAQISEDNTLFVMTKSNSFVELTPTAVKEDEKLYKYVIYKPGQ